jgi:hypothetical protein
MMVGYGQNVQERGEAHENKAAFRMEVYVCISDKLVQQYAEIQYYIT